MRLYFESEKDWLNQKKKDVTSTEVAALFGLNLYKSRLRLWNEKAGMIEDDFEESPFSIWGQRLQIPVGLGICEDECWDGYDMTGHYFHDPDINSGASLDMKVICRDRGTGNLEIKVAESFSEKTGWTETSAPVWYEFQMQMQMHEAYKSGEPFDFSCLGTLGRRQSTRLYFREYDPELGLMIDNEIKEFWQSIKDDMPPHPDYAVDGDLLQALAKPVRIGETRNLSLDNRAIDLVTRYNENEEIAKELRNKLKKIDAEKTAMKAEIHAKMGNAESAIIGSYQVGAKMQFNDEKFVPAYEFRRLDIKKRK